MFWPGTTSELTMPFLVLSACSVQSIGILQLMHAPVESNSFAAPSSPTVVKGFTKVSAFSSISKYAGVVFA